MARNEPVSRPAVAFFDMDKTLISKNSANLYASFLFREGLVGPGILARTVFRVFLYKFGLLKVEAATRRAIREMAGKLESETIELCERWFREDVVPSIYPEAVELIEEHKAQGHDVALLSAATNYVIEPLSDYLGLDGGICTRLEVADGKFTGKVIEPMCYGEAKIHYAEEYLRRRRAGFEDCWFYTDSITDLPLLELVGNPVAVNPDPLLSREARMRGWPVMNFKPCRIGRPKASRRLRRSGRERAG